MLRRLFLTMLISAIPQLKKRVTELDKLIFRYNSLFGSATFLGDQVLYDRDVWDNIREAFTKIIEEFR